MVTNAFRLSGVGGQLTLGLGQCPRLLGHQCLSAERGRRTAIPEVVDCDEAEPTLGRQPLLGTLPDDESGLVLAENCNKVFSKRNLTAQSAGSLRRLPMGADLNTPLRLNVGQWKSGRA